MPVVWYADFEAGNNVDQLKNQLDSDPIEESGSASFAVVTDQAHSGTHSLRLRGTTPPSAGARAFRKYEIWNNLQPYWYGCWFYFPVLPEVGVFFNLWQFKSNHPDTGSSLGWKLEVRNLDSDPTKIALRVVWDGQFDGPFSTDDSSNKHYLQEDPPVILPIAQWTFVETYLEQSENFDGTFIVKQDGVELFRFEEVRTKQPGANNNWSVNFYGDQVDPSPYDLFVDDMAVSTTEIYSVFSMPITTLQPDDITGLDTYIRSDQPTNNFSTLTTMRIGETTGAVAEYRGLIKFDLSSIPSNAIIQSARLRLFMTGNQSSNGEDMRCFRLLKPWTSAATYNTYDGTNNWETAGGFGATDCEQTDIGFHWFIDLPQVNQAYDWFLDAALVQEWLDGTLDNNGLLIKNDTDSSNNAHTFATSRHATEANRPQLEIIYSVPETIIGALAGSSGSSATLRAIGHLTGSISASSTATGLLDADISMALTESLISFWPLDELSSIRADVIGSNHLADNNTVGSDTGIVYPIAAEFVTANSESLTIASNTFLQTGDIDFWLSAWIFMTSKATHQGIISKVNGSIGSTTLEYTLRYLIAPDDRFNFTVASAGSVVGSLHANNLGSPGINTWYNLVAWHDSVNNQLGIVVNAGTPNTLAFSNGVRSAAGQFAIGRTDASVGQYFGGLIGPVMLGKGYVPTTDDIDYLYNSGVGRTYPAAVFLTDDTWQAPAGVTEVTAEVWGNGGSGPSHNGTTFGRGGGGGGAFASGLVPVTPGNIYNISRSSINSFTGDDSEVVQAANGSNGSGQTGGAGGLAASSIGNIAVFSGGIGGTVGGGGSTGGGGGGSSAGPLGAGANGGGTASGTGGAGGSNANGGGRGGNGGNFNASAQAGTFPGGAGGGAGGHFNAFPVGGAGAGGLVRISWVVAEALMDGSAGGSSTVSGTLKAIGRLEAVVSALSDVVGQLEASGYIEGSSPGHAQISGLLVAKGYLVGQASGNSISSVAIVAKGYIIGDAIGSSTAVGRTSADSSLQGAADGLAFVSGKLTGIGSVEGLSTSTSQVLGTLSGFSTLVGSSSGSAVVSGLLSGKIYLIGSVQASSTVTGFLRSKNFILGLAAGNVDVVGIIFALGRLQGSSIGTSTASLEIPAGDEGIRRSNFKAMYSGMFRSMG